VTVVPDTPMPDAAVAPAAAAGTGGVRGIYICGVGGASGSGEGSHWSGRRTMKGTAMKQKTDTRAAQEDVETDAVGMSMSATDADPFLLDGYAYGPIRVPPGRRPRHVVLSLGQECAWALEDAVEEMRAAMQAEMAKVRAAVRGAAENTAAAPRPGRKARPGFYTVQEAAEIVRAPVSSVRSWIYDGRLPAKKVGKRVLIAVGDLARFTGQPR
jgi:excisionase family DNA binding protein